MSWAKVGMKVVCVLDCDLPQSSAGRRPFWRPAKGEIYTVELIGVVRGHIGLGLVEQPERDWVYFVERFRPLVSKEDDIAVFKRIADHVPNMEDVG